MTGVQTCALPIFIVVKHGIPSITTMTAATAAVRAIASGGGIDDEVRSLQEIHRAAQEAASRS